MPFGIRWLMCSVIIFAVFGVMALVINIYFLHKKKVYKTFFRALWADLKARIGDDAILPLNIGEAMKFYPALPKFEECLNLPLKKLVSKVSWTIDPREHGIRVSKKLIKRRPSK